MTVSAEMCRSVRLLAHPSDIAIDEPWYLVSNADPTLDLV
jgi:hypothetical protein